MSPVLTVKEMADYLRVHETTVYRLLYARAIPAFRVAGGWRFNLEHVEAWTRANEVKAK